MLVSFFIVRILSFSLGDSILGDYGAFYLALEDLMPAARVRVRVVLVDFVAKKIFVWSKEPTADEATKVPT